MKTLLTISITFLLTVALCFGVYVFLYNRIHTKDIKNIVKDSSISSENLSNEEANISSENLSNEDATLLYFNHFKNSTPQGRQFKYTLLDKLSFEIYSEYVWQGKIENVSSTIVRYKDRYETDSRNIKIIFVFTSDGKSIEYTVNFQKYSSEWKLILTYNNIY